MRIWQSRREQRINCGVLEAFIDAIRPRRCSFVRLRIARTAMYGASLRALSYVCEPAAPHGVCGAKCVDRCRDLSLESSVWWLRWT